MHCENDPDFCFVLLTAGRQIARSYRRYLSRAEITTRQFLILSEIGRQPNMAVAELASALAMDRTSLVRVMKPLQRRGFVCTYSDVRTNRHRVVLTGEGLQKLEEGRIYWAAAQANVERILGVQRVLDLRRELTRLMRKQVDS